MKKLYLLLVLSPILIALSCGLWQLSEHQNDHGLFLECYKNTLQKGSCVLSQKSFRQNSVQTIDIQKIISFEGREITYSCGGRPPITCHKNLLQINLKGAKPSILPKKLSRRSRRHFQDNLKKVNAFLGSETQRSIKVVFDERQFDVYDFGLVLFSNLVFSGILFFAFKEEILKKS